MTFQIGEKVVYPNQGVAIIENISTRPFGAQVERFYLLRFNYNGMTVMVPFSHAGQVGLRKVTRNGELSRVLTFLAEGSCSCCQDWKVRFKINSEKMSSGGLTEVAEVMKTLLQIQQNKPLSFREKKMLDRARHMLLSELASSRGMRECEAIELLSKALAKANLPFPAAR